MSLTAESVAKITASIVVGMIQEAAYRGVSVTAQDLSDVIAKDPGGETATYFVRNSLAAIALAERMQADAELLNALSA